MIDSDEEKVRNKLVEDDIYSKYVTDKPIYKLTEQVMKEVTEEIDVSYTDFKEIPYIKYTNKIPMSDYIICMLLEDEGYTVHSSVRVSPFWYKHNDNMLVVILQKGNRYILGFIPSVRDEIVHEVNEYETYEACELTVVPYLKQIITESDSTELKMFLYRIILRAKTIWYKQSLPDLSKLPLILTDKALERLQQLTNIKFIEVKR